MTNTTASIEQKRLIAKRFLLASPPGQFQQTVMDLNSIFAYDDNFGSSFTSSPILSRDFIDEVQTIYNQLTGGEALVLSKDDECIDVDDEFGKNFKAPFQKYIDTHYKGKGVESNYCIHKVKDGMYEIVLYAQRIKLKQFHAGSWFAKYTIQKDGSSSGDNYRVSGVVLIHAHSFEDGNVHVQSNVTLPIKSVRPSSTSVTEEFINIIQNWDEDFILRSLKGMYVDLSSNLLKKMRRVMPVTRSKFDWNMSGHRFVRAVEKNFQK